MIDRFLDWQLKIFLIVGLICIVVVFLFDFRGVQAIVFYLFSATLIFEKKKIYQIETSENWLKLSYSGIFRNIFGGVLMLLGWGIFLRGVLAPAIASMFLKAG